MSGSRLTSLENDEEVEKLSERDVSVVVFVDHFEHVCDEGRVRLETERVGELRLGQLTADVVSRAGASAVQRLAGESLVVLQSLQTVTDQLLHVNQSTQGKSTTHS